MSTTESHRERVIAVLEGEKPDVIPCLGECPMDVTALRDAMPPSTGDGIVDAISRAEFFDNSALGTGIGVRQSTVSQDPTHHLYRYETGAVWREEYVPTFCREPVSFPVGTPAEALAYDMPDALSADRVDDHRLAQTVSRFKAAGYFVHGGVPGAWQGIYYYLTSFENILTWMAIAPGAAHALFDKMGRFSLDAARRLLRAGVDCIFPPSDFGSARAPLFSREMFQEYALPWLRDLATLCHEHHAYLHLHSHGHIQDLMDDIVSAGVDIVNPVGPSDHNDLAYFKRQWGENVVLHGGISTTIAHMTCDEIEAHVGAVLEVGRHGGRFFPRTESGIPPMSPEKVLFYLETLRKERQRGYA